MDALETRSDWTRAAGTTWYRLHIATAPIVDVDGPVDFNHAYTDTDHAHDIFSFAPESLVNKLDYVGDTKGNEALRRGSFLTNNAVAAASGHVCASPTITSGIRANATTARARRRPARPD
ncbi:hypothetical protein WME73_27200 [Sorangium sp. So ce302]|uniref:hypothetical protein n=1 Tax=Sorangium sp. So ce302 TaxID=3133297 RepID=UPI003F5EC0CA